MADDRLIQFLGDSHVWVFDHLSEHTEPLRRTSIRVCGVGGATALGLANPNSTTNALEVYREVLVGLPPESTVATMLGEIDCGFLAWLRSQERGTAAEVELRTSLDRYLGFIDEVLTRDVAELLVLTVPPPSVLDYASWAGLDNARRDVRADFAERAEATRVYNSWLRTFCAARDRCRFVDIEDELVDPVTGGAREKLRNPDPHDHHLRVDALAPIAAGALRSLGYD